MLRQLTFVLAIMGLLLMRPLAAETLLRGESEGMRFEVESVAQGLGVPWGMAFIAPDRILLTQRQGRIDLLDLGSGRLTRIEGGPEVMAEGQGGLLDVAAEPGYRPGGWLYFTYSRNVEGQGATTLARARLDGDRLRDWEDLLVTRSRTGTGRHFGSRVVFDREGHLFFGVGDRGERPNGQDLTTHAGTVMRLRMDGSVPTDNPFVGRSDALPEIWSYGHRNPQGMAYDHARQRLWEIEHGPRGGDEINLIERGRNYGWAVISYGQEYWGPFQVGEGTEKAGMEQPVKQYTPSIAPGSLLHYTGEAFPAWNGNLFAGALKLTHLNRVTLDEMGRATGEERLLESLGERIRSLVQGPEGWIYLGTDSGMILRIKPAGAG